MYFLSQLSSLFMLSAGESSQSALSSWFMIYMHITKQGSWRFAHESHHLLLEFFPYLFCCSLRQETLPLCTSDVEIGTAHSSIAADAHTRPGKTGVLAETALLNATDHRREATKTVYTGFSLEYIAVSKYQPTGKAMHKTTSHWPVDHCTHARLTIFWFYDMEKLFDWGILSQKVLKDLRSLHLSSAEFFLLLPNYQHSVKSIQTWILT